jgi:hypothetical protein
MLYWQVLVLLKYILFRAELMFSYMLGIRRKILLLERRRLFGPYKLYMRRTNDRGHCQIVQQRIGDGYHRNMIASEFLSKLAFSRKKCNVLRTFLYKFLSNTSLALTYYLEALPVFPPDNPDSLDTSTSSFDVSYDSVSNRSIGARWFLVTITVYPQTAHTTIKYMVKQSNIYP